MGDPKTRLGAVSQEPAPATQVGSGAALETVVAQYASRPSFQDESATLVSAGETELSDESAPADLGVPRTGEMIGGIYRVIGPLGEGSMGVTLLAHDEHLERNVAIKLLHPEQMGNRTMQRRFLGEARAMARVHHPNVVEIYAFGEHAGYPYFVMQYIEGTTLDGHAQGRGGPPLDLDEVMSILDQVCRGVSAIHASGTAHRDLKPGNILVGAALKVAVADLGLARKYMNETASGMTFSGTPAYLAPEVALGHKVQSTLVPRVDIYALGLIAYWLLVGRLPFVERDLTKLLMMHAYEPPPLPSSLRADLPRSFDDVLLAALAKDPNERTPTAEEFRKAMFTARNEAPLAFSSLRVLIADDNADFRGFLDDVLRMALPGAEIESVPDGSSAFAAIQRRPPSLAVFDLDMPGLDGIALTASVRALPACKDIPIIVATGSGGASDWRRLASLGASAFLVKPFDPAQLVTLARGLLGLTAPRHTPTE